MVTYQLWINNIYQQLNVTEENIFPKIKIMFMINTALNIIQNKDISLTIGIQEEAEKVSIDY